MGRGCSTELEAGDVGIPRARMAAEKEESEEKREARENEFQIQIWIWIRARRRRKEDPGFGNGNSTWWRLIGAGVVIGFGVMVGFGALHLRGQLRWSTADLLAVAASNQIRRRRRNGGSAKGGSMKRGSLRHSHLLLRLSWLANVDDGDSWCRFIGGASSPASISGSPTTEQGSGRKGMRWWRNGSATALRGAC